MTDSTPLLHHCSCGQPLAVTVGQAGTTIPCTACKKTCNIPELSKLRDSLPFQGHQIQKNRGASLNQPAAIAGPIVSAASLTIICLAAMIIFNLETSRTPREEWNDNAAVGVFSMGVSVVEFFVLFVGGLIACVLAIVGFGLSLSKLSTDKDNSILGILLSVIAGCATLGLAFYLGYFD